VDHRRIQSPAKQPDYVEEDRETTRAASRGNDLAAKGPENQPGYLKALKTEWDPDDRQAKQKPSDDISECSGKTPEEQP